MTHYRHGAEAVIEDVDQKTGRINHRYIKGRLLGKGGFAKCYEFTDVDTGRIYAAKLIDKKTLTKPKTQQKLKSEIKIHSGLRHHHIVKFEKFFEDDENVYILLEVCSQQTLMELQRRKRRLNEQEAVYLMQQTLDGVKYMHDKNIIHRDLKLGNLFLDEKMEIKIGDFGLAAQLEFDGERKLTVCGTPNYIAPEVLDGGKHGHSFEVDVWSLGVILYTLLVGRPPFETNDIKTTYRKIRNTSYSFPEGLEISSTAKRLIQRILQSNPESRPTLSDIMSDPFFTKNEIPKCAPYTLFPAGPQRQIAQERQMREKEAACSKGKGVGLGLGNREPLKPITNLVPDLRQGSPRINSSPRLGTRTTSPRNTRPVSDVLMRERAELDNLMGRRAGSERDFYRDQLLPPPLKRELPNAPLPSAGPARPVFGTFGMHNPSPASDIGAVAASTPSTVPKYAKNDPDAEIAAQHKDAELDAEDQQNLTEMHQNLSVCIQQPQAASMPGTNGARPGVWVTEYSDFSAKYGLAYKLSYGHTGAAFNDGTKMVWDSDLNRVEYTSRNRDKGDGGRTARAPEERVVCTSDDYPDTLKKKITLITYFKSYFSKYRGKNVTYPIVVANSNTNETEKPKATDAPFVYVKQWMKHSHAMVFRLSNKCFQVAFFDGTDILLSSEARMVTYTDQRGQSRTFALEMGRIPHKEVAERLEYTQKILYQIMSK
jgi:polo-like kinase 1